MKFFLILFLLQSIFLVDCKSLQQQVPGTYIEYTRHDTLELSADKTYTYDETLMNGVTGLTKGNWTITKKNIVFTIHPRPLMGFGLKILKENASDHPVFWLFLGNSGEPIEITDAVKYKDGLTSPLNDIIISGNRLELLSTRFDSIAINTPDYVPIILNNNLFAKQAWDLQIYPLERYYLLDKYIFRYKKGELRNINTSGSTHVQVVFKKSGNQKQDVN